MDDLRAFAEAGLAERRREVGAVQRIIADELDALRRASPPAQVAPLVAALHERAESVRQSPSSSASASGWRPRRRSSATSVEALTRGIVAKLLHEPDRAAEGRGRHAAGERLAEALRDLFDL